MAIIIAIDGKILLKNKIFFIVYTGAFFKFA